MDSVRKALRSGEVQKDSYGRLSCSACEKSLSTDNDPDKVGKRRICPMCGKQWRELR